MRDQCMQPSENKILFYVGMYGNSYDDEDIHDVMLNAWGISVHKNIQVDFKR